MRGLVGRWVAQLFAGLNACRGRCIPRARGEHPVITAVPAPPAAHRFDTIYVDDQIRVAQDSRGDTLVVARDGPPRRFT